MAEFLNTAYNFLGFCKTQNRFLFFCVFLCFVFCVFCCFFFCSLSVVLGLQCTFKSPLFCHVYEFIIRLILSHADIDTIEIRSDEEEGSGASKARRTYNYRVTYACCLTCFIYSSFVYNIFVPLNRKRGWSLLGREYVS